MIIRQVLEPYRRNHSVEFDKTKNNLKLVEDEQGIMRSMGRLRRSSQPVQRLMELELITADLFTYEAYITGVEHSRRIYG